MLPVVYGENMFDDLFDNSFFGSHNPLFGKNTRNLMKTDIRETDDAKAYRLAVDLPGFKKDEISLDLRDGYLTISAEKGSCPASGALYRLLLPQLLCRRCEA